MAELAPEPNAVKPRRSARKPKGEGHARRGEILQAAERIFVECGYEGATIRKIAEAVGLSSTALYMHFRDKSEILLEICETSYGQLLERHAEIMATPSEPVERVRRQLAAYIDFGLSHPNAYRLLYLTRPQESGQGVEEAAQRLGRQSYAQFLGSVREIGAAGRLKADADVAAQTLWAGAHGLIALLITKPHFPWAEREALIEAMLSALFEGLISAA